MKAFVCTIAVATLAVSLSARAQLTSVDGGLAVEDMDGMMFANIVSPNGYAGGSPGNAGTWVVGLNAENYGGYSDWSVVTGNILVPGNNTTNQLGYLLTSDCLSNGCAAFSALETAVLANTQGGIGGGVLVSRTDEANYGDPPGCTPQLCGWFYGAYLVDNDPPQKAISARWWNDDDTWNGQSGGIVIAVRDVAEAPEVKLDQAPWALTLLCGVALVLNSWRRR